MVVQYCEDAEFLFQPNWWNEKWEPRENLIVCQVCATCLWGRWGRHCVHCVHMCVQTYAHTHTETHLAQHQCSPRVVIEGAFEWKTISAVVAASAWPALPSGSRGRIGQAYSFHGLVWWGNSLPRGSWAQGRGGQGQGVVAWPSHTCPTLSLSLLPAPKCCLFTARCWCQFTLRGHGTKAHAGSSRFRMRIINLTSCKDRSQCRGRAISPTSCSGALQGKGEGGLGAGGFFFPSPNLWEQIL